MKNNSNKRILEVTDLTMVYFIVHKVGWALFRTSLGLLSVTNPDTVILSKNCIRCEFATLLPPSAALRRCISSGAIASYVSFPSLFRTFFSWHFYAVMVLTFHSPLILVHFTLIVILFTLIKLILKLQIDETFWCDF